MKENTIILLADDKYNESVITCRIGHHDDVPRAPFDMCFTVKAFRQLIFSVGIHPPETGAMAFGPKDLMGFDVIEFDKAGSDDSGGAVYRPSVEWGEKRRDYHLDQSEDECRLWTGTGHSHPGWFCHPSGKSGKGLGDLGYVEETFAMNEYMQWFFIPILTGTGTDEITIHPWICQRADPIKLMIADLRICRDVSLFPKRQFNPEWERSLILPVEGKKKGTEEKPETPTAGQENTQTSEEMQNEESTANGTQKVSEKGPSEEVESSSAKNADPINENESERRLPWQILRFQQAP